MLHDSKPLVTIVMPVVARPETAKIVIESVLKKIDFPYIFKVIIHPDLIDLIKWCRDRGIIVHEGFYQPFVKVRKKQVELCETKYLLPLNCDLMLIHSIKPMLDFMESHPEAGTCACLIKNRQALNTYGRNFIITENRMWHYPLSHTLSERPKEKWHYCDFTQDGAMLMRMEIFKDIIIDMNYKVGWEHEDLFMELKYHSSWKVVNWNKFMVEEIEDKGPEWYKRMRYDIDAYEESKQYFMKKWNVTVPLNISKKIKMRNKRKMPVINPIKICIVTEFDQKDFFQWEIALTSHPDFNASFIIVNPSTLNIYDEEDSFWDPIRMADIVFVYCCRFNKEWEWYKLPSIVKKWMRYDAKMICQFDLEFLWLWYPDHNFWKKPVPWADGKTPKEFFKETGVLEVADVYIVAFNDKLKKYIPKSKQVYYLPLPQLVRYDLYSFTTPLKNEFLKNEKSKSKIAIMLHSVKSAYIDNLLKNVIHPLNIPVMLFTCRHTGGMERINWLKKLPRGSDVIGYISREAMMDFLGQCYIAIEDNDGYYGWSRFAMECALAHVPCVGSSRANKEFFTKLYTKHRNYSKQIRLIKKLYNDRNFWYDMAKSGKNAVLEKMGTGNIIKGLIEIIKKVGKFKKLMTKAELDNRITEITEWDKFQSYRAFVKKIFPKSIPPRPANKGARVKDGIRREFLTQGKWDKYYGKWKKFVEGYKPEKPKDIKSVYEILDEKTQETFWKSLSIVVGVKNRGGSRVRNFCNSLITQTDKNFEVIMIDYGSNTKYRKELSDICKEFGFEYYFVDEGKPWSRARAFNIGIIKAWKNYVMTTDIDMIFRNDFVEQLKKKLNPNSFIWTVPTYLTEGYLKIAKKVDFPDGWEKLSRYMESKYLGPSRGAIQCASRNWFIKVNGYDKRMYGWGWEDTDMWMRAKGSGLNLVCLEPRQIGKLAICAHQWHQPCKERKNERIQKHNEELCGDSIIKKDWVLGARPHYKKTLSIVVAVRNRGGIRAMNFFQSLASQIDKDFEVIVIDYGSDKSHQSEYVELSEKYGFRYYRIDAEEWNRPRALNIGIGKTWGEYVMTTDIDMIFRNDFIVKLKKLLHNNCFIWTHPYERVLNRYISNSEEYNEAIRNAYLKAIVGKKSCWGTIQVAERKWFISVNGYEERFVGFGPDDWDMWFRAQKAGLDIIRFTDSTCIHQWHEICPALKNRSEETREKYQKMIADEVIKTGQKIGDEYPQIEENKDFLVTIIMPVVARPKTAKITIEALFKYVSFPYIFKVIIHPDLIDLIKWVNNLQVAGDQKIEVIEKFIYPMPKMKKECTKLCETKYLFMMDCDMLLKGDLKPMLDFMENHPNVGVCSTSLEGIGHRTLRYGSNFKIEDRIMKIYPCESTGRTRYCNYVHNAATFFRMKIFDDVQYDDAFPKQGYAHEDLFLQLTKTKWEIVNFNAVRAEHLKNSSEIPKWYRAVRSQGTRINKEYFCKKWGLEGVEYL